MMKAPRLEAWMPSSDASCAGYILGGSYIIDLRASEGEKAGQLPFGAGCYNEGRPARERGGGGERLGSAAALCLLPSLP